MVFIKIKHKIDSDATYSDATYSTIIKFPILEISTEWDVVFYLCPMHFERYRYFDLFMLQGVAALKLKGILYFLNSLHTQPSKHIF